MSPQAGVRRIPKITMPRKMRLAVADALIIEAAIRLRSGVKRSNRRALSVSAAFRNT
jgi:hypothetical protein